MKVETPELDKMRAVKAESAILSRFLDWLEEHDTPICERVSGHPRMIGDGEFVRIGCSNEELLARYFEIDLDKVESERRALLDEMRRGGA